MVVAAPAHHRGSQCSPASRAEAIFTCNPQWKLGSLKWRNGRGSVISYAIVQDRTRSCGSCGSCWIVHRSTEKYRPDAS
eukprot:6586615-Prymnesium_polylepis.1